jgi:hypothetical protein
VGKVLGLAGVAGVASLAACEASGNSPEPDTEVVSQPLSLSNVDTLSQLRSQAVPTSGTFKWINVDRHGSSASPDKTRGGGVFRWDPTFGSDSAFLAAFNAIFSGSDDDGTVIKPTALTAAQPGRWVRDGAGEVNVEWFGAVADGNTAAPTSNDKPFEKAIKSANFAFSDSTRSAFRAPKGLVIPAGTYKFTRTTPLPTLTGCTGMVGRGGRATLEFSVDGDCIVAKGPYKVFRDLYINNRSTTFSTRAVVLHIKNCAYGTFENLNVNASGANSVCLSLEHEYTGSDDDAYFIVHLGCWYNTFKNISCIYTVVGSAGVGGYGLELVSTTGLVKDPPNQPPGTYFGSANFNTIITVNIEGKERGINLSGAAGNTFIGGVIGGGTSVFARNSSAANVFLNQRYSYYKPQPFDIASTPPGGADTGCRVNLIVGPTLFPGDGVATSLGDVGDVPLVLAVDDSDLDTGLRLGRGRVITPGGVGYGDASAASALGTVVRKVPAYDAAGNLIGFIPLYDAIG